MIHTFQELQEHHGGQAGAWGVLTKVLAQGAGVASGEGDRASAYCALMIPSILFTIRMMALPLLELFSFFPQVSLLFPPTVLKLGSKSLGLTC